MAFGLSRAVSPYVQWNIIVLVRVFLFDSFSICILLLFSVAIPFVLLRSLWSSVFLATWHIPLVTHVTTPRV